MPQKFHALCQWLKDPFWLIRETENFERTYFRAPKYCLKWLHQWPCVERVPLKSRIIIGINFSLTFFAIFCGLKYSVEMTSHDLSKGFFSLAPCITVATGIIKLLQFAMQRVEFRQLITELRAHLEEDLNASHIKRDIIRKFSRISIKYTVSLSIWGVLTFCLIVVRPVVVYLIASLIAGSEAQPNTAKLRLDMPYPISLPYFRTNFEPDTLLYNVCYLIMIQIVYVSIMAYCAVDSSFMCFCLFLSAAQCTLRQDFEDAFEKYANIEVLTVAQNDTLYQELARLQHRRAAIMRMSKKLTRLFWPIILTHFPFAALSIGITSIVLIFLAQGYEKTFYITHNLAVCTQLFIYCSGAEYLNENTQNFAHCCYESDWYKCNVRNQKLILLSIGSAQCGCKMNVPCFNPSLHLFQMTIRTAASYITFLQTFL